MNVFLIWHFWAWSMSLGFDITGEQNQQISYTPCPRKKNR